MCAERMLIFLLGNESLMNMHLSILSYVERLDTKNKDVSYEYSYILHYSSFGRGMSNAGIKIVDITLQSFFVL